MKNTCLLFVFLTVAFNVLSIAQESKMGWEYVEIYIITTGLEESETIRYEMKAISPVWLKKRAFPFDYAITNEFKLCYYPPLTEEETNNSNPDFWYKWKGFNHQNSNNVYDSVQMDSFAYGLYKISQNRGQAYFYLDYRDNNWGYYSNCAGHCQDIWIKYDKINDSFSYLNKGDKVTNFNDPSWVQIENLSVLRIFSLKNQSSFSTDEFPFFWKNCLAVTDYGNGNPRLFWSKHPTFTATNYKIYRAVSSVANPRTLTYNLIHTTATDNVFEYTDQDVALGNSDYVFYYVAAYNSNTNSTSEPSNVVTTRGGMYKQNQLSEEHKTGNIKYELSQNTPNPFNPSTTISFTVPSSTEYYSVLQNVTLKVYDILGNEVATLVDENKPAGMYNVQCIMNNASSGVYFYKLKAGSFTETKKMLLMK